MSGPKRADVEAQLKVARNGQRQYANLIASAEKKALQALIANGERQHNNANNAIREATQLLESMGPQLREVAGDSVRAAQSLIQEARRLSSESGDSFNAARDASAQASNQENTASATHRHANQVYDEAEAALRRASNHYLRREMDQAEAATRLFNQAERELADAARSRGTAAGHANQAVRHAEAAASAAQNALNTVRATRAEAEARQRAAEEARRIAEEKQRNATLAFDGARAAFGRLAELPHAKFRPGAGDEVQRSLNSAQQFLKDGDWDTAMHSATQTERRARQIEEEVRAAQQEYERLRTEAEAQMQQLASTIEGTDADLIRDWADDSEALRKVETARQAAQAAMDNEEFESVGTQAQAAREILVQALHTAAQNKSRHEVREEIGEAVMDVLQDLGFDVSSDDGTRTKPLRIAGQTPETSGRGDFNVSIPLSGEVNFLVNTPDGDTSCVAAVKELQKRLAERGIEWNTTDWGHAEGSQEGGITETMQSTETTQQGVKMTGRR
jgi:hypothetical protein